MTRPSSTLERLDAPDCFDAAFPFITPNVRRYAGKYVCFLGTTARVLLQTRTNMISSLLVSLLLCILFLKSYLYCNMKRFTHVTTIAARHCRRAKPELVSLNPSDDSTRPEKASTEHWLYVCWRLKNR